MNSEEEYEQSSDFISHSTMGGLVGTPVQRLRHLDFDITNTPEGGSFYIASSDMLATAKKRLMFSDIADISDVPASNVLDDLLEPEDEENQKILYDLVLNKLDSVTGENQILRQENHILKNTPITKRVLGESQDENGHDAPSVKIKKLEQELGNLRKESLLAEKEIIQLSEANQKLKIQLALEEKTVESLSDDLDARDFKIQELTNFKLEFERLDLENQSLNEKNQILEASLLELQDKLDKVSAEYSLVAEKYESVTEKCKRVSQEYSSVSEEYQALMQKFKDTESRLMDASSVEIELDSMKFEIETHKDDKKQLDNSLLEANQQIESQKSIILAKNRTIKELEDINSGLESQISQIQEETARVKLDSEHLESGLKISKDRIFELESLNDKLQIELTAQKDKVQLGIRELSDAGSAKSSLQQEVAFLAAQLQDGNDKVTELELLLVEVKASREELLATVTNLESELISRDELIGAMKQENASLSTSIHVAENEINLLLSNSQSLRESLTAKDTCIEALNAKFAESNKEAGELKMQISDLELKRSCQNQLLDSIQRHAELFSSEKEAEIKGLKDLNSEILIKLSAQEKKYSELEARYGEAMEIAAATKNSLQEIKLDFQNLESLLKEKTEHITSMENQVSLLVKENEILAKENSGICSQRDSLLDRVEMLIGEVSTFKVSEMVLTRENSGLLETVDKKDAEIAVFFVLTPQKLLDSILLLEQGIVQGVNDLKKEADEFKDLEMSELKSRLDVLLREKANACSEKAALMQEVVELKAKFENQLNESENVEFMRSELKKWSQAHRINLAAVEEFKTKVEKKISGLKEENERLKSRLQKYEFI